MSRKKIITVPKDRQSEIDLDYDKARPDQLIEVSLDESEFMALYRSGFFNEVNIIADTLIEEYESEAITDMYKLEKVLQSNIFNKELGLLKLAEIRNLFEEAIQRNTGVYFYF